LIKTKELKKTTIQVDEEVLRFIQNRKRIGERDDYNKVLRRELFGKKTVCVLKYKPDRGTVDNLGVFSSPEMAQEHIESIEKATDDKEINGEYIIEGFVIDFTKGRPTSESVLKKNEIIRKKKLIRGTKDGN